MSKKYKRKLNSSMFPYKKKPFYMTKTFAIACLTVFVLVFLATLLALYIDSLPEKKLVSFFDYYKLDTEMYTVVIDNERIQAENSPVVKDGEIFMPVSLIKDKIDGTIFWDKDENKLTITTSSKVIRMKTGDSAYYINNKPIALDIPIRNIDNIAFIPQKLLCELYEIDLSYVEETKTVFLSFRGKDTIRAAVIKNTELRFEPNKKSFVEKKLAIGDELTVFDNKDQTNNGFTQVLTEDGLIGYVKNSAIGEGVTIPSKTVQEEAKDTRQKIEGTISMAWEGIYNTDANGNIFKRDKINELKVISPTWFSFETDKLDGNIVNLADKDYVDKAHEDGYLVWALISDNFDGDVSHSVLSSTKMREKVINQLLAYVSIYDLDGINIDFEMVRAADIDYYHQFLRELAPLLREQGAVLTVDMYVPSNWSMYYNRGIVAEIVDYVIIMGYDEHTQGSDKSGPVASYNFVENGIINTLNEVPKEKLILGIPFYVRVWKEKNINNVYSHKTVNMSMEDAYNLFVDNAAEFVWDNEVKSYYSFFETIEDGEKVTYRVWLEDEKSIEEKLKLMEKYELAGFSAWRIGFENDKVWQLIMQYIK